MSVEKTTFKKTQFDILIVGGGIVGSTAFALISKNNPELNIGLVNAGASARSELQKVDPRVVALSYESKALFEKLDVWNDVVKARYSPYYKMHVWDAEGTGAIHFDCEDVRRDALGYIVENSILTFALEKKLKLNNDSECLFNTKVTELSESNGNKFLILDNHQEVSAPLVIAADGAQSFVRQQMNISCQEWDCEQSAIITTVYTEKPHQNTARQRFISSGPLAFLPLDIRPKNSDDNKTQHASSIVWTIDNSVIGQIKDLDDEGFCAALGEAFEFKLGKVLGCEARHCIPLRHRSAERYGEAGIALVGDAAHTIHPLAGQGANLGIADVQVLTEEISRASLRGLSLSDSSIVKRYERRRRSHNVIAMRSMEGFKRLFGSDNLNVRMLRNMGLNQLDKIPFLKNKFIKLAGN